MHNMHSYTYHRIKPALPFSLSFLSAIRIRLARERSCSLTSRSKSHRLAHINHVPRTIPSNLPFHHFRQRAAITDLFDKGHIGPPLRIDGLFNRIELG